MIDFSLYRQGGDPPEDQDLAGTRAWQTEPSWPGMNAEGSMAPESADMTGCRRDLAYRTGEAALAAGCWHAGGAPCECGCHASPG